MRFTFGQPVPLPSEEGTTQNVLRDSTCKPIPQSGLDCPICAGFARQRSSSARPQVSARHLHQGEWGPLGAVHLSRHKWPSCPLRYRTNSAHIRSPERTFGQLRPSRMLLSPGLSQTASFTRFSKVNSTINPSTYS